MEEKYQKIIEAAKAGGQILKNYFGQELAITEKTSPADFFTKADTESERAILDVLKKAYPDYNIYSEEDGKTNNGSDYTFVIDPLDGSNNFVAGIPNFSVSIALLKGKEVEAGVIYQPIVDRVYCAQKNKETVFGLVYQPILDLSYYAVKGEGAFLNGQPIFVNNKEDISDSSISMVWGYVNDKDLNAGYTAKMIKSSMKRICFNWSVGIDFCLLASGKIEAVFNNGCDLHDFLAGKLIAKEAGAFVTDMEGKEEIDDNNREFLITNNKVISDKVFEILK